MFRRFTKVFSVSLQNAQQTKGTLSVFTMKHRHDGHQWRDATKEQTQDKVHGQIHISSSKTIAVLLCSAETCHYSMLYIFLWYKPSVFLGIEHAYPFLGPLFFNKLLREHACSREESVLVFGFRHLLGFLLGEDCFEEQELRQGHISWQRGSRWLKSLNNHRIYT